MRVKISKQPPPAPTASAVGPCPTVSQAGGRPRHWKFTQHHRTTRPPSGCLNGIFLDTTNLICRSTDISKCFRGSLRLRDNESRLNLKKPTMILQSFQNCSPTFSIFLHSIFAIFLIYKNVLRVNKLSCK